MLLEATKQGRIFMVNYLLESKKVDINETDKNGQTPLISACLLDDNMANTRRKLIRLFLTRNVDVNQADVSGRNALMWACQLGKIDVVKILFGRSLMELNFTCTDHAGNTALHYASSSGQYTLTTMLVEAMKRFGVCTAPCFLCISENPRFSLHLLYFDVINGSTTFNVFSSHSWRNTWLAWLPRCEPFLSKKRTYFINMITKQILIIKRLI